MQANRRIAILGVSPSLGLSWKGQSMRWNIRGRDGKTGNVVNVSIEAPTLHEAEQMALYNGMVLLEADRQQNAKPPAQLGYSSGNMSQPAAPRSEPATPDFSYLRNTARWLRVISIIVGIVGCIMIVWPFVEVLVFLIREHEASTLGKALIAAISAAIPGMLVLLAAASGRMLAAIGLAIHDVAEQNFKKPGEREVRSVNP